MGTLLAPSHFAIAAAGTLVVTSCALSNSDDFTVDDVCSIMVTAQNEVDLHVGGTPRTVGTRTTTLTITDNASGSPHSIQVMENGTGAPTVQLPASLDLGNQLLHDWAVRTQTVTLHNAGNVPLMITNITTTSEFAQANDCGSSLAAAASCTISVRFRADGARPAHRHVDRLG